MNGDRKEVSERMVEVKGLTKYFGRHQVLRGVDLEVGRGEFLTIFGPNGAGKTTLIKILSTLSKPSSGEGRIAGWDIKTKAAEVRRHLGVVSHETLLYHDLTAYENLKFYGKMFDVPHWEERIVDMVRQVGLESRLYDRVGTLSHGMQKRLSIARALLHHPSLLLLDEPETGLDQQAMALFTEVLNTLVGGECTIIMTTHNMERGLKMGNRVAILSGGRIVYQEKKPLVDIAAFAETYYKYTGVGR